MPPFLTGCPFAAAAAAAAAAACCCAVFLRPRSDEWMRTWRVSSSEREKRFSHLRAGRSEMESALARATMDVMLGDCKLLERKAGRGRGDEHVRGLRR